MTKKKDKYKPIKDTKFYLETFTDPDFKLPEIRILKNCICKVRDSDKSIKTYISKRYGRSYRNVFLFPELGFVVKENLYSKHEYQYVHVHKNIWQKIEKSRYSKYFPKLLHESKEFAIEEYRPAINYEILFSLYSLKPKDRGSIIKTQVKNLLKKTDRNNKEDYSELIDITSRKIANRLKSYYYENLIDRLIRKFGIGDYGEDQCGVDENGDLVFYDYAPMCSRMELLSWSK